MPFVPAQIPKNIGKRLVNPIEKGTPTRSGRGVSGGSAGSHRIDQPYRQVGMPPIDTTGSPSMSFDVNASEILQNKIMNNDDREWYDELFQAMNDDFLKPRWSVNHSVPGKTGLRAEPGMDQGLNAGKRIMKTTINELRKFVRLVLSERKKLVIEPDDVDKKDKKPKKKEVNAITGGSIAGYTGPLGAGGKAARKKRKKNAQINAKFFGGGSIVGKLY